MAAFARAKPLLGTIVGIRLEGLERAAALEAAEAAFAEVAAIHACMSFHAADSDLSRLHRARGEAVAVDARTFEVLRQALVIAAASNGVFDPTIAAHLVASRRLPSPLAAPPADPTANWRDIELLERHRVRLTKPVWIDLGGIAKGYAVDRALAILHASGAHSASVNAGGDLARFGADKTPVMLDTGADDPSNESRVAIDIGEHALATSSARPRGRERGGYAHAEHLHGRTRRAVRRSRTVSVVAASCCTADALTKVMLADARVGARLLRRFGARAYLFESTRGWRACGE